MDEHHGVPNQLACGSRILSIETSVAVLGLLAVRVRQHAGAVCVRTYVDRLSDGRREAHTWLSLRIGIFPDPDNVAPSTISIESLPLLRRSGIQRINNQVVLAMVAGPVTVSRVVGLGI